MRCIIRHNALVIIVQVICLPLMLSILTACRQVRSVIERHSTDSLNLFGWEQMIVIHERLDSLGRYPVERIILCKAEGREMQSISHFDSISHKQVQANPPDLCWSARLRSYLLWIGVFALIGFGAWLSKRLGKLASWLRY